VIRNGHYWNQANNDYAPWISNRAPDFAPGLRNFLPSSARYDSGEGGAGKPGTSAVYGGHSHVGTMIYLGDNWPAAYRDHLFTHNLHGHQINHQVNVRTGSGYETFHGGHDVLFSPDPTYLPVDLQYGPDRLRDRLERHAALPQPAGRDLGPHQRPRLPGRLGRDLAARAGGPRPDG
jgi:hypothetical protein